MPASTLLRHSGDDREPLLALPDVVAWATRRLLAVDEPRWFTHVKDVTTLLDGRTGARLNAERLMAVANVALRGVGSQAWPSWCGCLAAGIGIAACGGSQRCAA